MDTLTTQIYIDYLLSDKNNALVQIWDNRLFIWKYKGSPRFESKLGLEFNQNIYYRPNEYKQLSKKYHPDLSKSKSSQVLSGFIQTSINDARQVLENQNRGYAPEQYQQWYAEFDRIKSCKSNSARSKIARELSTRLYNQARLVQDRFGNQSESLTQFVQEMGNDPSAWGEGISSLFNQFSSKSKERARQNKIRHWNRADDPSKQAEGNPTIYGTASKTMRRSLRREYGDVFSMYIGGPCDTSPL